MKKKQNQNFTLEDIKKLLAGQTTTILKEADSRFIKEREETENLLSQQAIVILSAVDEKLKKTELSINEKINQLTNTLDEFLKRLTIAEDEFEVMKLDINRMKKIIKEKLGVELS